MSYEAKFETSLSKDQMEKLMREISMESGFYWYGGGKFGVDVFDTGSAEDLLFYISLIDQNARMN